MNSSIFSKSFLLKQVFKIEVLKLEQHNVLCWFSTNAIRCLFVCLFVKEMVMLPFPYSCYLCHVRSARGFNEVKFLKHGGKKSMCCKALTTPALFILKMSVIPIIAISHLPQNEGVISVLILFHYSLWTIQLNF